MTDVFWAANAPAPLTRDQQIEFMKNSRKRREESIERWKNIVSDKDQKDD